MKTRSQTAIIKLSENPRNPTCILFKWDLSEMTMSFKEVKVKAPCQAVGGGSTGRGKSQPKTEPKYDLNYFSCSISNYSVELLLKVG